MRDADTLCWSDGYMDGCVWVLALGPIFLIILVSPGQIYLFQWAQARGL